MTILNPEHLFEQAERLIVPLSAGPPRQVDVRRAISAAYYGLFHHTLAAVADLFVGASQRGQGRYALVYRSIDHRTLKEVCIDARRPTLPKRYGAYVPSTGLGPHVGAFASSVADLQEKRHRADYDPEPRFRASDALLAVSSAREAIKQFKLAGDECQKAFLTLLLCPPR